MNIGDEIINKIVSGKLFTVGCAKCDESNCVVLWSSGASEQIEAIALKHNAEHARKLYYDANRMTVLGALDSLGCLLADKGHFWTEGERTIYEQAVAIVQEKRWRSEE